MAGLFDEAASHYLYNANAVLAAVPLAMVCRFNTDSVVDDQTLMGIFPSGGSSNYFRLWIDAAANHVNADATSDVAGNTQATSTNSYTANTWRHAAGVYATSTDKRAFLDGTGKGTNDTAVTPAGMDQTEIGRLGSHGGIQYTSGMIAECAIWDLSNWPGVTAADKANNFERILPSLAAGFSPRHFLLGLKAYWRIINTTRDIVGGYTLTNPNGVTVAKHPRIIFPTKALIGTPSGEVIEIIGTFDAQSAITGTLDVSRKIVGTADGQSDIANAPLAVSRKVVGTLDGQSAIASAPLKISRKLIGTVDAQSAIAAAPLYVIRELIGTITIQSALSADLHGLWLLYGTIAGTGAFTSDLTIYAPGRFNNYAENKILDHVIGKTPFTMPTIAIGLCSADPGEEGSGADCNELPDADGYSRIALAGSDWNVAAAGEIDNANPITFPVASGNWGLVTHYALFDALTYGTGNILISDFLDASKNIVIDEIVKFSAGELVLTLD